jgi:imidazolonepropionase-like amidohydrolase
MGQTRRGFLLGAAAGACIGACATPPREPPLAILGARIVDPAGGGGYARADVLVRGGRIADIGDRLRPPEGAVVVDAGGKFLTPGLWDMHAHIAQPSIGRAPENYVGWGVLGIRDCGGQLDALLQLRREIAAGRVGPDLYIAGPTLNGAQFAPHHRVIADAEQARAAVRELKAAGVDFIKTHRTTSREAFFALVEEARRQDLDVGGHVPLQVTWEEAAAAGMRSFEHVQTLAENEVTAGANRAATAEEAVQRLQGERLDQIAAALRAAGAYFDPTLIFYERNINNRPEVAARRRQFYEVLKVWTGRIHRAGVSIIAGTDDVRDFGEPVLLELERLVECGLSPRQALRAATATPAGMMRRNDIERIVGGACASFLIVDGDPDADVANLRRLSAVVLRGRLLDAATLAALRQV